MSTMIDVQQLSKRFGAHVAVDDLTFQVQRGEAVALWGANGAGKTTVLRCLLHLLPYRAASTSPAMIWRGREKPPEHRSASCPRS